jgi:hypothetical protein
MNQKLQLSIIHNSNRKILAFVPTIKNIYILSTINDPNATVPDHDIQKAINISLIWKPPCTKISEFING